jgi:type I restriction-modification system DNA methylase subunit
VALKARTKELLTELARRPGHDEVKSFFGQLLVEEFGVALRDIGFEKRVPEVHGRIDALIGRTVFEAKRDMTGERGDVEKKMPDYLSDREREEKEPFVGIASDGKIWAVYELEQTKLVKIKETQLNPEQGDAFLAWLDGVLVLRASLKPDAITIKYELGKDDQGNQSVAYRRAQTSLREIWAAAKDDPAVALKRQLWAQLLKLVYGKETENDDLWFQHTFLVIVAKAIAAAVMDLAEDDPAKLLSGEAFQAAGILGAVESDFFDWPLARPEGADLVRRIVAHVRRFRLREVESDVLKILYESLIDRAERHGLGEYYTPDWLAAKVVRHTIDRPLEQRVLDPACGSGTFLFHAIRAFLAEAEEGDMAPGSRAAEACAHVAGTDIHPVAVIIARVTVLLALVPALRARKGTVSIPVYLGDAMQLSISQWMGGKELKINVPPPPAGHGKSGEPAPNGGEYLDFPETFCRDPALFDKAIERMRTGSLDGLTRAQIEAALVRITEQHYKRDITDEEKHAIKDLGKTYVLFDRLRKEGRDTVWAYVARNLSRPLALSASGGWANVVIGNPPWVAFRHMSADLQKRFKEMAKGELVYDGGKLATQSDLCALFTVRAAGLYLRASGRIAFVLPLAALTRGQFEKFRTGQFSSAKIAWDEAWTMDDGVSPLFPVPSCVLFGRRRNLGKKTPETVRAYAGTLPRRDASEEEANKKLKVTEGAPKPTEATFEGGSPYREAFRQGATLVPRMLCLVERKAVGRLGGDASAPLVVSRRTNQEKEPWRSLPGVEHKVESEFLRPILLGESILPYRVWNPFEGVIPVTAKGEVIDAAGAANRGFDGLHGWMKAAERIWNKDRPSEIGLTQQFDYYGKLGAQFPLAPLRVVYTKAGNHAAAAILKNSDAVIDHKLYWSKSSGIGEAYFLVALFNSEETRSRVESMQSRGQFGARDFDKVMFNLPIPRFDEKIALHRDLAAVAEEAEKLAAKVVIPDGMKFQMARRLVREALTEAKIAPKIDALVARLLDAEG